MAGKNIEHCRNQPGEFIPAIDRNRCEGKEDCVAICPYDVFVMQKLSQTEKSEMPFLSRFKARVHGNWQAFAVRPEACHACGLCVKACPEHAIRLVKTAVEANTTAKADAIINGRGNSAASTGVQP